MADESSLKLPDEYTELSYEDGELSGSGNRKWTSEDTQTAVKWGVSIIAAGTVIGLGIKYRTPIRNGISYAWNQITGCCSPNRGDDVIPNNQNIANRPFVDEEFEPISLDNQNKSIIIHRGSANEVEPGDIQQLNKSMNQIEPDRDYVGVTEGPQPKGPQNNGIKINDLEINSIIPTNDNPDIDSTQYLLDPDERCTAYPKMISNLSTTF